MDATTKIFLAILKDALNNRQADPGREIGPNEWQKLFHLASIHNVLPIFCAAAYAVPSLRQADQAFVETVKRRVRQQVTMQSLQTDAFLALNRTIQAAGVKALVVKGIICRSLYPQPDYRLSSDEDILIPADQFDKCHQVITAFGMQTTVDGDKRAEVYEIPYHSTESPLYIELHKHLFPPESDAYGDMNRFFEEAFRRTIPEEILGNTVYTLEYTDHLFYLICHAFKHFLHSGFGIRQVCDIILYANAFGRRINWLQILDHCREIHADKFAAAVFQIGSNYLVFDPDKAAYPSDWRKIRVNELPLLEDLLSAGVYGGADMSRKHSSNITLDAVAAQKQGRKAKGRMISSAFPSARQLESRYPYLQKHPYLLPVAWCSRFWKYSRELQHSRNNNAVDALKIGSERIALMKEYGILK